VVFRRTLRQEHVSENSRGGKRFTHKDFGEIEGVEHRLAQVNL
jgi:hypothetical protein